MLETWKVWLREQSQDVRNKILEEAITHLIDIEEVHFDDGEMDDGLDSTKTGLYWVDCGEYLGN